MKSRTRHRTRYTERLGSLLQQCGESHKFHGRVQIRVQPQCLHDTVKSKNVFVVFPSQLVTHSERRINSHPPHRPGYVLRNTNRHQELVGQIVHLFAPKAWVFLVQHKKINPSIEFFTNFCQVSAPNQASILTVSSWALCSVVSALLVFTRVWIS